MDTTPFNPQALGATPLTTAKGFDPVALGATPVSTGKSQAYAVPSTRPNLATLKSDAAQSAAASRQANSPLGMLGNFGKAFIGTVANSEDALGHTIGQTAATGSVTKNLTAANKLHNDTLVNLSKAIRAKEGAGQDATHLKQSYNQLVDAHDPNEMQKILPVLNKTNGQVAGELGSTALDVLTAGVGSSAKGATTGRLALGSAKSTLGDAVVKNIEGGVVPKTLGKIVGAGKDALKGAAKYGSLGYGYDVSNNLQNKSDAPLAPGVGTALGVLGPAAGFVGKAGGIIGKAEAPRMVNSLIKPLGKDFSYGKNPGKTVAEMGITGNSLEDLGANISQARTRAGQDIGQLTKELDTHLQTTGSGTGAKALELESSLIPINEAMNQAARDNNPTVLARLQNVKDALVHNLTLGEKDGVKTIVKGEPKNLAQASFNDAFNLKKQIGDMTQFTGNPSDDKIVNGALKRTYGNVKGSMLDTAKQLNPEKAAALEKLNEQYAGLTSAEVATKYRDIINQRHNMISAPIKAGTAAGLIAAPFTGGLSLGTLAVGAGVAGLDKMLGSAAVKTRVAKWLASESPGRIEKVFAQHPGMEDAVHKAFNTTKKDVPSLLHAVAPFVVAGSARAPATKAPAPLPLLDNPAPDAPTVSIAIPPTSRLAYVNNNPGNLRYAGQDGAEPGEKGFAKFASPEEGYAALKNQVQLDQARGLTLAAFVGKYAPPTENNTREYLAHVAASLGVSPTTRIDKLDTEELAKAIAQKESGSHVASDILSFLTGAHTANAATEAPTTQPTRSFMDKVLGRTVFDRSKSTAEAAYPFSPLALKEIRAVPVSTNPKSLPAAAGGEYNPSSSPTRKAIGSFVRPLTDKIDPNIAPSIKGESVVVRNGGNAPAIGHELFHSLYARLDINPADFNKAWEEAKKNDTDGVLSHIDTAELNSKLYKNINQEHLANERFAYLGQYNGVGGLTAMPPELRSYYNGVLLPKKVGGKSP